MLSVRVTELKDGNETITPKKTILGVRDYSDPSVNVRRLEEMNLAST